MHAIKLKPLDLLFERIIRSRIKPTLKNFVVEHSDLALLIARKSLEVKELFFVCNQLAPLKQNGTEAFMFKVDYQMKAFNVQIVWHDREITQLTREDGSSLYETIKGYYSADYYSVMSVHTRSTTHPTTISNLHATNTANLHQAVALKIKDLVPEFVKGTEVSSVIPIIKQKLANVIKELDSQYDFMIGQSAVSPLGYDARVAAIFINLHTVLMPVIRSLTETNTEWTVFELKRLLRMTINDYLQSILENPARPLQSSFHIDVNRLHVKLQRLSDVLARVMTAARR